MLKVVKETLMSLNKKSIDATPNAYTKEFCMIAKRINLTVPDCQRFKEIVQQLSLGEQEFVEENEIQTLGDIIPLLLKRVKSDNLDSMASLLSQSLQPSISIQLDEELHKFSIKIDDSPELMFETDIQTEIKKFIEKRIDLDKNELELKAKEIAKVMTLMTKSLTEAIDSNSEGSSSISDIAQEIIDTDTSNHEHLISMQDKLVNAAKSIESTMSKTTNKLKAGQNQVQSLQNKIKDLEDKLAITQKESDIDHLTGLLTRRAYTRYARKIDDNYNRNQVDYAVVFFDIDHFKKVNDDYGHDAGDAILATFAKVLSKSTRDLDIVGRYGGEEFIAILHFDDEMELETYIKRVKSIVTDHKFKYNNLKIQITFSAGVTLRSKNKSYDKMVKKADELLYQAKNTGRNKIIFQNGLEL